jgi:hypothetical protein
MRLPTDKGKMSCENYIQMKKFIKLYDQYQTKFLKEREKLLQIELKDDEYTANVIETKIHDRLPTCYHRK